MTSNKVSDSLMSKNQRLEKDQPNEKNVPERFHDKNKRLILSKLSVGERNHTGNERIIIV